MAGAVRGQRPRFRRAGRGHPRPGGAPPSHPLRLARFGAPTLLPATVRARAFSTDAARALLGGVAVHGFHPLHRPLPSAVALGLLTAGQSDGWPVAAGGSQSISNALAALLTDLGGKIETGVYVRSLSQLPPAEVTMFDLAPATVADILGDRLPTRAARAYRRFRRGPGAFKVDFAVEGGVPWTAADAHRAGTTEAVIAQIERFAPGFRERIVATAVQSPADFAADNPNFTGGDIITGAKDVSQLVFGPRRRINPYSTGVPGMYLCSAATPPAPGAHGMCGYHAAHRALRHLRIETT